MAGDPYGERQLEILRTVHGPLSAPVAARLVQAVQAAQAKEDWAAVLSLGREGLRVKAALVPRGDMETLLLQQAVAQALHRRHELPAARSHFGQAIQLCRSLKGEPGLVAELLLALARVLQEEGELARARAQAAEAAELLNALPGASLELRIDIELLRVELAAEAGAGEQALVHLQRAQQMARTRAITLGGQSRDASRLVAALEAAARSMAGKRLLVQARQAAEAALQLLQELEPPAGPAAHARLLSLLGDVQRRGGDPAAARSSWEQALQLLRVEHGETSTEVAIQLNNLGALCWDMSQQAEGYELVRQANRTFCELLGFTHPHTQASGRALIQMRAHLEEEEARRR